MLNPCIIIGLSTPERFTKPNRNISPRNLSVSTLDTLPILLVSLTLSGSVTSKRRRFSPSAHHHRWSLSSSDTRFFLTPWIPPFSSHFPRIISPLLQSRFLFHSLLQFKSRIVESCSIFEVIIYGFWFKFLKEEKILFCPNLADY